MAEKDNIYESIGQQQEQSGIDLKKYLFKALKYWYLFVISLLIAYFIAYWQNKFTIPVYGLHTTVLLNKGASEEAYAGGLQVFSRSRGLSTEIGVLKSFSIAKQTITELDFSISYYRDEPYRSNYEVYKKSPFVIEFDTTYSQYNGIPVYVIFEDSANVQIAIERFELEKKAKINEYFEYKNFRFKVKHRDSTKSFNRNIVGNKYFFRKNNMNSLANSYKNRVQIEVSPEGSNILWLWVTGTTPQKDADYLNKLVDIFIRQGLEEKNEKINDIIEFIDEQLMGVSDSLQQSEGSLQFFKEQNQTLDLGVESRMLLKRLNNSQTQIMAARYRLGYYKSLINEIEKDKEDMTITSPSVLGVDDKILSGYLDDLANIIIEKQILEFNVKGEMPKVREINFKIEKIKKQIINHAQSSIDVTQENLDNLNETLRETETEIAKLPAAERKIINIERKFNINDDIYTMLFKRRIEASITKKSNEPDAKALDPAKPFNAKRKGPNTAGNTRQALIIGFLIPVGFIVVKELLNNKIETKSDIENNTKIPIIGTIGNNHKKSDMPVLDNPKSPISEAFRAIRTNLQYILREAEQKTIVFTSSISGEGKSFISANFAAVLALSQKKTLLVGLDMRKPKLQKEFDYPHGIGMSSYLSNYSEYEDIIRPTRQDNLYVALSGDTPPNPAELIESEKLNKFIKKAEKEFDYIVIDTPPVGIVTDALLLADIADSFLYVVRQNYSGKNVLKLIEEVNRSAGLKKLNILMNDVKISKAYGYGYGYGYGYNYGYGQGYYDEDHTRKKKKRAFFTKIKKMFKNR